MDTIFNTLSVLILWVLLVMIYLVILFLEKKLNEVKSNEIFIILCSSLTIVTGMEMIYTNLLLLDYHLIERDKMFIYLWWLFYGGAQLQGLIEKGRGD